MPALQELQLLPLLYSVSGGAALLVVAYAYMRKGSRNNDEMKSLLGIGALLWAVNMSLHAQWTGAGVNLINFFRNRGSMQASVMSRGQKGRYAVIFSICYLAAGIVSATGDHFFYLPMAAAFLGIFSLYYLQGVQTQFGMLGVVLLWLAYAIAQQNDYLLALQSVLIVSCSIGIYRTLVMNDNRQA